MEPKLKQDHVGNKINIDDRYLQPSLAFLETLNYVQVGKVTKKPGDRKEKAKAANATEAFLDGLPLSTRSRRQTP